MAHLTLLRGLSAAGKTSWARAHNTGIIVSRDAIRPLLTGDDSKTVLGQDREALVTALEHAQIETALRAGVDVISDNLNLTPKFARAILDLAVKNGATWTVQDFLTSRVDCHYRNRTRLESESVPSGVIEEQARRHPMPWPTLTPTVQGEPWTLYVPDTSKPEAIAVDLDGTLAHMTNRGPYDATKYLDDAVDEVLRDVVRSLQYRYHVLIVTGRDGAYRTDCETWLAMHDVPYDALFMRTADDKRPDQIVKSEILDRDIAPNYNLRLVFDDRLRVVRMWRARGVKVAQVAEGDF